MFNATFNNISVTDPGSISLQYAPNANETNERFTRTIRKTHHTGSERTIHARANYWNITIYYPMTNDPGSIEVQYSIVLLFE